jgi:hypothetical protein
MKCNSKRTVTIKKIADVGRLGCISVWTCSALKMEAECSSEALQVHMQLELKRTTSATSLPWEPQTLYKFKTSITLQTQSNDTEEAVL